MLKTSRAEIVALCDIYQPPLDEAAVLCPKAKKHKDNREVLASRKVEDILVACPLHLHAAISIARLKAGKHVFFEMTIARTLDQCQEIYDTYKQTGKVLHIGHLRLFDSKYIKALEMVHKGILGSSLVCVISGSGTMIGGDGSEHVVSSFCDSAITGKPIPVQVEEASYAAILSLIGLKAMEEKRIIDFPDE